MKSSRFHRVHKWVEPVGQVMMFSSYRERLQHFIGFGDTIRPEL